MEQTTPITNPPPHPISSPPFITTELNNLTPPPPPPPPFPFPSNSIYLTPLEFLLALVAVITIPTLIYNLIFNFACPFIRRRMAQNSDEHSVHSDDTSKGVDAALVANLVYRKDVYGKEIGGECSVCLSAFVDGENLRQLNGCKHSFHADCINLWLRNHCNCPICRATVAGKCTKPSLVAAERDDDLRQGLPDASDLV